MCPTCGKPQLTERPHQHPNAWRDLPVSRWDQGSASEYERLRHSAAFLDPDPRVPDDSTPPRLPSDDGNPGPVIALVVLAAIVVLAVVGWLVAVPR